MDTSNIAKRLQKYESEVSSILGVLVVLAITLLLFFFLKRSAPTPQVSNDASSTQSEDLMNKEEKGTYTVKDNQGLWDIAEEFYQDGYKWTEIAKANGLTSPYVIQEGQTLVMPELSTDATPVVVAQSDDKPTVAPATTAPLATSAPEEEEETEEVATTKGGQAVDGASYTVVEGDSLWEIAVKQYNDGYKWVEIYRANKATIGSNPGIIRTGQVLVIPGK